MGKQYVLGAGFLLALFHGQVDAQLSALDRWAKAPASSPPIASGRNFDLAFGGDQFPVLAFIDGVNPTLNLKKWDGSAWTNLSGLTFSGQRPLRVQMASNWAGDIVVGLLMSALNGDHSIEVYQLRGAQLRPLGPAFNVRATGGYAVAMDARGPVVASWQGSGFVTVRRWSGVGWGQLGGNVNASPVTFVDRRSPALAVTGDGKLVVAYSAGVGNSFGIVASVWDGAGWTALGSGVAPPATAVNLGGENSGAPVVASSPFSRVSRWNGVVWQSIGQPCVPTIRHRVFGDSSLTVRGNEPLVVCGIHINAIAVIGRRTLVARTWSRVFGWKPLGLGTINGDTDLADGNYLAYVVRSDPRGRPWVAWTAQSGIFVSTLVPPSLSSGP
ncbi:MAG: hypothetical protein ABI779_13700 [Acidobacteriota bacterium]